MTRLLKGSHILVTAISIGLLAGCAAPAADKPAAAENQESGSVAADSSTASDDMTGWLLHNKSTDEYYRFDPATGDAAVVAAPRELDFANITLDRRYVVGTDDTGRYIELWDIENLKWKTIDMEKVTGEIGAGVHENNFLSEDDGNLMNVTVNDTLWVVDIRKPYTAVSSGPVVEEVLMSGEDDDDRARRIQNSRYNTVYIHEGLPEGVPELPLEGVLAHLPDGTYWLFHAEASDLEGATLRALVLRPGSTAWESVGDTTPVRGSALDHGDILDQARAPIG